MESNSFIYKSKNTTFLNIYFYKSTIFYITKYELVQSIENMSLNWQPQIQAALYSITIIIVLLCPKSNTLSIKNLLGILHDYGEEEKEEKLPDKYTQCRIKPAWGL